MKKLILSLILLLGCSQSFAATLQTNSVLPFSGIASGAGNGSGAGSGPIVPLGGVNTSGFVTIGGSNGSTTSSNYFGFYGPNAIQYQITGGTLYVSDIWVFADAANQVTQVGYGTAALVSEGTVTPPTGVQYYLSTGSTSSTSVLQTGLTANVYQHYSMPGITFPPNSYPFWRAGSTGLMRVIMTGIIK